jgi:hypothetical protein
LTGEPPTRAVGLFVSHRGYLEGAPGGAQVCTREYIEVLRRAGVDLVLRPVELDQRPQTRLLKRLDRSSYVRPTPPGAADAIAEEARARSADFIFLNQMVLAGLAPRLRPQIPSGCRIVALSHGLESTDLAHLIRLKAALPLSGRRAASSAALGRALIVEQRLHAGLDLVCALSEFDVTLHRWLGASDAGWTPRVIEPAPLAWSPTGDRLGYFGTLDHAPNLEGLALTLEALTRRAPPGLRVRVVGAPARIGDWLRRFACVDYLGPLDDGALAAEAAGWSAVMHPIFCLPRGCSTKLAQAIGWQIPIVTTTAGRRGYDWRDGALITADTPTAFVDRCLELLDPAAGAAAREQVRRIAGSSPSLDDAAALMGRLLGRRAREEA